MVEYLSSFVKNEKEQRIQQRPTTAEVEDSYYLQKKPKNEYYVYVMKMAAVDSKSCKLLFRPKYPVKGKISSHLPKNPLSRLQCREASV